MPELAKRLHGRVGFDDAHTSVANLGKLEEELGEGVELVPAGGLVEGLRRRKDPDELEAIAEAARLADEVYEAVLAAGFAGRTEREVARAAERRCASSAPSPRSRRSSPPARTAPCRTPSRASARSGPASSSCGTWARSSTATARTAPARSPRGRADGDAGEVYELVEAAQEAGLEAVRPGVDGEEADAAARAVIRDGGHGDHFGHGLGHGVGLEVHEAPRLGKRSEDVLAPGDVVTVEPGVYVPGRFGVRIEDLVVVTDDGVRNLSSVPKALRVV